MSQNTSPQPFDFKRSATKEDLKKPSLEPMINPFMAKEPQEILEDANKEMQFAAVDTPLKTTEIETLNPDPKLSPTRTNKLENDHAIVQTTPRFENKHMNKISSEKKEGHKKQLFTDTDEPNPKTSADGKSKKTTPEKALKAKNSGQKFKKVALIDCTVRLDTTLKEFDKQGGTDFFKDNLSKSLGLPLSQIDISSVREGSVIVDYTLTVDQDK